MKRYTVLKKIEKEIIEAYLVLEQTYAKGGKLLIAGNGGSAADAEHIVGELMKGFKLPRKLSEEFSTALISIDSTMGNALSQNLQGALPAIALDGHPALTTAFINDCDSLFCFAQQVSGLGKTGDVFLGISTSGNSRNVLYAAIAAKAKGMKVIGLTGSEKSILEAYADVTIMVPEKETYMVQELHLPIYHCWCLMLEEKFWGTEGKW